MNTYMRITVDGARTEIRVQRKCDPKIWNRSAGREAGTKESTRQLNNFLDLLKSKVFEAQGELISRNSEVKAEKIRDMVQGKTKTKRTLVAVYKEHIEQIKAFVGEGLCSRDAEAFQSSIQFTGSIPER